MKEGGHMKATHTTTTHHAKWWRVLLSGVCIVLATVVLLTGIVTRYINDNVLDTDRYIELVGPLPQDPKVAAALGTFTAERIFNSGTVENQISEFLPPRLSPAAPLLSEALQEQVAVVTENIVSSKAFTSTWTQINRRSHERLIELAHSEPLASDPAKAETVLALDGLFDKVRERFGDSKTLLSEDQKAKAAELKVDLQQSVSTLRTTVSAIEMGAWLLPLIAIVLLAGAVLIAQNRRKAWLAIGVTLTVVSSLALFALKVTSNNFLDGIEQPVYRDAAQVIYDTLYGNLQMRLTWLLVTGVLVVALSLLFGPYRWATRTRQFLHLTPEKHFRRRS
jgi:hypothetical protein